MDHESLSISFCSGPDYRVDAAGGPVFPVWSQRVHDDLKRLSALFGARMEVAQSSRAHPNLAMRSGNGVIALEPAADASARLYAHLTGRAYLGEVLPRLVCAETAAVAVGTYASWSNDLLQRLVKPPPGRATVVGLIIGDGVEALARQVVLRAAALFMSGAPLARRVAFLPHLPLGLLVDDQDAILGRHASPEEVRTALAFAKDGPSAISILGHSDGIDAQVTDHVVMCPLLEGEARYLPYPVVDCLRSGHCYRTDRTRAAAAAESRLISPLWFEAALLVHDGCSVIPAANIRIDPRDSLGARLVEDCVTGAFLFNANVSIGNVSRAAGLLQRLAAGRPLGEAVARFNSATSTTPSRRLVLIGDPAIRFGNETSVETVSARESPSPTASIVTAAEELPAGPVDPDLDFSRSVLARMRMGISPDTDDTLFQRWHQQLDRLEQARSPAERRAILAESAAAQTACFLHDPTNFPQSQWLPDASLVDAPTPRICFCCDAAMDTMVARFARGFRNRNLAVCPNCSACVDGPEGAKLDFVRAGPGRFALQAQFNRAPAHAELFFHAPYPSGRRSLRWPNTRRGSLARNYVLDDAVAPTAWMIGLFVSFGTQFAFMLAPTRWSIWRGTTSGVSANQSAEPE